MKNFLKIIFLVLGLGVLIFAFAIHPVRNRTNSENRSRNVLDKRTNSENGSRNILDKLTVEQKAGQMFIIGFEGREFGPKIEGLIKNLHPGGVLLLKRNIENREQVKNLIQDLQKTALEDTGLPLFVAVDQEGGEICRLEFLDCTGQAEIENEDKAFQTGLERGEQLGALGINLNLAPVLDQSQKGDFVFERTFQRDIEETGNLAKSLILGQKKAGLFTAIKHFPGYGGIDFNPETQKLAVFSEIPAISQFQKAMEAKPEIVMTANAVYTEINRDPIPVSSKGVEFLKEKLGKDILIISDDLSSPVLKQKFSLEATIILAQKAGIDILLVSGFWDSQDPARAYNALLEEVKKGKISQSAIDKTALKIIRLKLTGIRSL